MKIAINTVCMPELTWQEALAACKTAGFSDIELLMVEGWSHVNLDTTPVATVLEKAAKLGVRVVGVHAGGIDGTSEDGLARTLRYIRRMMALATDLGSDHVVFSGFGWPADLTDASRREILQRIARGVSQIAEEAAQRRLNICLENHYRCQIETLEDYQVIFSHLAPDSPWIGATVDTGHFTSSQVDPVAVVRGLGRRVLNVHVKDHVGTESKGLGYGNTDNAAVVRALREVGYDGYLTAELEVHDRQNALRYVREAYPYLERLIAQG